MNFGVILLAFFLVAGSIFAIFAIAGATQAPITDTFGNVQTNQTNATQSTIGNVTAPLAGAGGGLMLVLAVFVIFIAAVFVIKASFGSSNYNTGRR
jgi:hypothetical protein